MEFDRGRKNAKSTSHNILDRSKENIHFPLVNVARVLYGRRENGVDLMRRIGEIRSANLARRPQCGVHSRHPKLMITLQCSQGAG